MPMRLIDADLAPIYLNDAACEQIKTVPIIDTAPVVRCKDCKYLEEWITDTVGFCSVHEDYSGADDFCSYGELREEIE